MKIKSLALVLVLLPTVVFAATRDGGNSRVGVRASMSSMTPAQKVTGVKKTSTPAVQSAPKATTTEEKPADVTPEAEQIVNAVIGPDECRDAYRECMDDFCMLDESEGGRCSCSDNIKQSKSLIQEIQKIQSDAELLYTEGVEREKLGARAKFVKFGESETAKKASRTSGIDLVAWINGGGSAESLAADDDIGDNLYAMAADSCEYILSQCDAKRAEMEEKLYQREVIKDCKAFDGYLAEQKRGAESNKRTAQAAVRSATLDMLSTTNKYNRGECLLAYRACISDKGGCGVNFENCLDAALLNRRANACENVLDQCMAVKSFVLEDWTAESKMILADAAVYSDENMRLTCNAKIRACLEEGCSVSTDSGCLTNVNVAAGVCPIIDECDAKIPGIKQSWNNKLAELRTNFCQNDVDKCLRDKCGTNFTAPECVGKNTADIVAMCPQAMFASCKNEKFFDVIVSSVLLQMDYQMVNGCINYFAENLGRVCGTDMNCLPKSDIVENLNKLPKGENDLRDQVRAESKKAVTEFMKQFENEKTIAACKSAVQPAGRRSLKDSIFTTAKMIAEIGAENRYLADLESRIAELSRAQDVEEARQNCLTMYAVEKKPKTTDENKTYSYIRSVSFEPSLRNCHVCRMQRVCETGGESKAASALKAGAGGVAAGASAGVLAGGWGALIGGVGLGALGAIGGAMSGGQQDFCQEIESCEDINM
ncbi:MAG: hypothetical protein IJQ90_01085 [Alphaproteobacteria bacterium]|nr:hypothetical protein [Alphaproteobacteria bacterium]